MSGHHVVYGFLRPYARRTINDHDLTIMHYEGMDPPQDLIELGVKSITVSKKLRKWTSRTIWEITKFRSIVRSSGADLVLTVSGAMTPGCPVPQAVLCQNPWCYVQSAQLNWKERLKARMQRIGYRNAFSNAAMMIYISGHLRDLYRQGNPGRSETRSDIAYVGLNQDTFQAAQELNGIERDPYSIVSVSAMAPWKGAETLVKAVSILRKRDIPAKLRLVGPWPNPEYESRVRELITTLNLQDSVTILGRISDEDLHREYATNQVFSLMSTCESFGIPAAEAMAFGTPVISTDCCAISEICQPAGTFGPAGDPEWTANALQTALTDRSQWQAWSDAARQRAATLNWDNCAQPLLKIPELVNH